MMRRTGMLIATDGTRTATFGDGPVEDICETLA
jgi:hypothetical protein